MKKLLAVGAVVLTLALLLTLAPACGNGDEEPTPGATPIPGVTPTPGATPTPTPEAKTLKIGSMGPLSGPAAAWGLGQDTGAHWAADDINDAGGIKVGNDIYMIKVISCNTQISGSIAATCASELVYDHGIHFIVGPIGTGEAIMPIITQNKAFVTGLNASWMGGPERPYYIDGGVFYPPWILACYEQFAEHHPEIKSVAVISVNSEDGRAQVDASRAAAEAVGMELVADEYYEGGTMDFYPFLTKVLPKNPDAIEAPSSGGDAALIAAQARQLGYTGWFMQPNWVPIGLMKDTIGLSGMYNIYSTLPDFDSDFYSDEMRELSRRYMEEKAKSGETDMPDTVVHGYSHMMFYAKAIEQAGSIDPEEVMKVFDDPSFRFERYYHSDGSLGGMETFGILRQMTHFNPYGEVVVEGDEARVVMLSGKVVRTP